MTVTEVIDTDHVKFVTATQANLRAAADAVIAERAGAGMTLIDVSFEPQITDREWQEGEDETVTARLTFKEA